MFSSEIFDPLNYLLPQVCLWWFLQNLQINLIRSVRILVTKVCLWPCFGCSLLPEALLLSLGACFICPFVDIDSTNLDWIVVAAQVLYWPSSTSATSWLRLYSTTDSNTIWYNFEQKIAHAIQMIDLSPSKMWKFLLVANDLAVPIKNVEISTSSSFLVCYVEALAMCPDSN